MEVKEIHKSDLKLNGSPLKVTQTGHILEVQYMSRRNTKGNQIIQLDKEHYIHKRQLDVDTGEIEGDISIFNRSQNRADNIYGLRKSMKNLRDIINTNVIDVNKCRWVTLTYRDNMQDLKQLKQDHDAFIKRLKRYHCNSGLPSFEYINCVEPQGRGAWHIHSIWIYQDAAPYLPNSDIAELWGHGFVTVKAIDNVDNVGAYLTAYLCDIPVDEKPNDLQGVYDTKYVDGKKYIKGARLPLYPPHTRFYRCSKGISKPVSSYMSRESVEKKVGSAKPTYEKCIRLVDDETGFSTDISYTYYNISKK